MKVPHRWLNDYAQMHLAPQEYQHGMMLMGFEMESYGREYPEVEGIVIGRILKMEKHPDADKLQVCQVDVGNQTVQIVTGADNVYEGAVVPVALDGTTLPNGVTIRRGVLRGVASHGMLCSGEELKLKNSDIQGAETHGILILPDGLTAGRNMLEALGMDDMVYDFEILANRPDCLSILGIARETSVLCKTDFMPPKLTVVKGQGNVNTVARVTVEASDLCPRYCARVVRDIRIAPSPDWMQQRLRASGVRPINNIVDITNYVMLEYGQPMHAFDLKSVHDAHIIVRRAEENEQVVTLDGKTRVLNSDMLVIADPKGAVGLAGIMGGENSEITPDTQSVLFESAQFLASSIRVTSKALGLTTEASARFAKGVDAVASNEALQRAVALVEALGAGQVVGGTIDVCAADLTPRTITIRPARISAILTYDVSAVEIARVLSLLGIGVQARGQVLLATVPHWRGDMEGEEDVAEEIARVHGYDSIPTRSLKGDVMRGQLSARQKDIAAVRDICVAQGAYEVYTLSFTGPSVFEKLRLEENHPLRMAVPITNPFGEDQSLMRTTLLPSMLQVMATNANRKQQDVRFFEVSNVQLAQKLPVTDLPEEKRMLCAGLMGQEDFYTLKGFVENLSQAMDIDGLVFEAAQTPYFHPGRCAAVKVGGRVSGYIGEVHPLVAAAFDLDARVYIAELDIDILRAGKRADKVFKPLPRFLSVYRDIALVVEQSAQAGELETLIRVAGGELVRSVGLFDVYEGKHMEAGYKSLAYTIELLSDDHTLNDEEIQQVMARILTSLEQHGAKLRT